MKKIISIAAFLVFAFACNNESKESTDNSNTTPGARTDSIPRNAGNDTAAYEGMQNRVTDSAQ